MKDIKTILINVEKYIGLLKRFPLTYVIADY